MKKLYLFLLLPLVIYYGCTGGCNTSCTTLSCWDLISGKYNYTMLDSLDNKLVEGELSFVDYSEGKVSGIYTKDKILNDSFPGYSSMKGSFSGKVDIKEKKLFINTNPKIADNNIFIKCDIIKDSLAGKWTFSTMLGIIAKGNFFAKKIKK
jgi:hypothetical protein